MTTGRLEDAVRALRDGGQEHDGAVAQRTRARILGDLRHHRARRAVALRLLVPLAAVLAGSTAWAAATGRLPDSWHAVTEVLGLAQDTGSLPAAPPSSGRSGALAHHERPNPPSPGSNPPPDSAPGGAAPAQEPSPAAVSDTSLPGNPLVAPAGAPAGTPLPPGTAPASPPVVPPPVLAATEGPAVTAPPLPAAAIEGPAVTAPPLPAATPGPTAAANNGPSTASHGPAVAPPLPAATAGAAVADSGGPSAASDGHALYAEAHRLHFVQRNAAAALSAWDAYLRAAPRGRFAVEAHYNRALCLVRLGRTSQAKGALQPFASGAFGGYRQAEARALLDAMADAER